PETSVGPKASIQWMSRSQKQTKTLRIANIQNRPDLWAGSSIFLSVSTKKGTEKKGNSVFLDSELLVHPSSVLTCEKPVIANDSAINRY
ncbi:MAG: hypothetical protein XE05_1982, partial [Thermotogales bacterium 46_20]